MGTFYFIFAFIIVLGFYAFSNSRLKKDFVIAGDSLPSRNLSHDEIKEMSVYKKHKIFKDTEGNIINPNNIIRMVVSGNSMSKRGIKSGDEILVVKIDKTRPLNEQIKKDDLLCIYLDNIRVTKIRAFGEFVENGVLTYYFDDNGLKHYSSIPHSPESVIGIAKYKIGN